MPEVKRFAKARLGFVLFHHARLKRYARRHDLIDPVVGRADTGPAIELFSRRERPGWDAFGNQVVPREEGA
ncbi:MAG TPA: hypothetical protein PLP90_01450 [Methanoculleus sp.]|nr:hypothetical protein [Methanoculleus sp.]